MVDRLATARSRLSLPTPCPECSDRNSPTYCGRCIDTIATIMGLDPTVARRLYGMKPRAETNGV
jgi:hypothetical protein